MHSSVMNAPIKLLLSQGNKIDCLRWVGGLPEKVELYRCAGTGIRFFRGQFLPEHQASGGNFSHTLGFW